MVYASLRLYLFFFNDTATTEIYTLSLHDALPISTQERPVDGGGRQDGNICAEQDPARPHQRGAGVLGPVRRRRSEEHTSELQSHLNLVCRLLLEKKKINDVDHYDIIKKEKVTHDK